MPRWCLRGAELRSRRSDALERPVVGAGVDDFIGGGRIVWYGRPEMSDSLTAPEGGRCEGCGRGRVYRCAACGRAAAKGFPTDGGGMVCYPCAR